MSSQDPPTADLGTVQAAYATWSSAYIEAFGAAGLASDADRARITGWARGLTGPVLDAGCGPGHWSAHLRTLGLEVEGVDATPEFVEHAQRFYPGIPFRTGDLRHLDLEDGSLGGVLAWFSTIHLDPVDLPGVLRAFASALRPGGSLLLGFFSGSGLQPFDHRVVTAWAWPMSAMADAVEAAGLEVVDRAEDEQPNGRIWAAVTAVRPTVVAGR